MHNGIIENYLELRKELQSRGHTFASQTDSEVIAHLIEEEYEKDRDPVRRPSRPRRRCEGSTPSSRSSGTGLTC